MKKPFMNEVSKIDAEKIVNEKMQNFWTVTVFLLMLLVFFILGCITGDVFGEREGRKEQIQELCTKQQYDFCAVEKVIYKVNKGE